MRLAYPAVDPMVNRLGQWIRYMPGVEAESTDSLAVRCQSDAAASTAMTHPPTTVLADP